MATESTTLEIIIKSKGDAKGTQQTTKGLKDLKRTVNAVATALAVMKSAQVAVDFVKFGADVSRAENALDNLAGAAGTSGGAIVGAMQEASDFTIDRMSAMGAANKALVMEVAQTPEQFTRLTKVATALGRAMGQDATKSIDDFIIAAARQSRMIADNLGLTVSVGQANERYARILGKTTDELTGAEKKMAFLNMMLEQGEAKMAELGPSTKDAAAEFEALNAALKDAKADFAQLALEYVGGAKGLSNITEKVRGLATTWKQASLIGRAFTAGMGQMWDLGGVEAFSDGWNRAWRSWAESEGIIEGSMNQIHEMTGMEWELAGAFSDRAIAMNDLAAAHEEQRIAQEMATQAALKERIATLSAADGHVDFQIELEQSAEEMDRAAEASAEYRREQDKLAAALDVTAAAQQSFGTSMGMSYTQYQAGVTDTQEQHTKRREEIEQRHQEALEKLQARGASKRIGLSADEEEGKLAAMREKLAIYYMEQDAYTDKTSEATKARKAIAIRNLEDEISGKQSRLDSYYAGTLIAHGENVTTLLEEEQARYDEELSILEAARLEQEDVQRQSLGRMVLQHFESWAEMNGITGTQFEDMRLTIAEEYGLITEAGATSARDMVTIWEKAVTDFGGDMKRAMDWWDDLEAKRKRYHDGLSALDGKVVDIRIRTIHEKIGKESPGATVPELEKAMGGLVPFDALTLVGERGPELVSLPKGSWVYNARETRGIFDSTRWMRRGDQVTRREREIDEESVWLMLARRFEGIAGGGPREYEGGMLPGGEFPSSRGQLWVPDYTPERFPRLGGARIVQTWYQTFVINAAGMDARELAREIRFRERLEGAAPPSAAVLF